jgi:hypothetical protein
MQPVNKMLSLVPLCLSVMNFQFGKKKAAADKEENGGGT